MMTIVTIVHILACIILVLTVLLQAGKGADMGAVFGGGSSTTIFGSSGAGNFLTRLTTGAAIVFMLTSLTLTYGSTRSTTATIMPEHAVLPAAPAAPLAGGGTEGDASEGLAGDDTKSHAPEGVPAADEGAPAAAAPGGAAPAGEAAPAAP
jgi:preprotein translocase subunit SecG